MLLFNVYGGSVLQDVKSFRDWFHNNVNASLTLLNYTLKNIKAESLKLLEKNLGKRFFDIGLGNGFLDKASQEQR